jgi:hypothetical protein
MGRFLGGVLLSSVVAWLTGCGGPVGFSSGGDVDAPVSGGYITGHVHGGQNPVSGATVSLYIMGLTGYGSTTAGSGTYTGTAAAPAGVAVATTTTDINGNYTFAVPGTSYCPATANITSPAAAADILVYVTATGGNSGGALPPPSNSAIAMMAILGAPTSSNGSIVSYDTCNAIFTAKPYVAINEVTTVASMYALAQFYNPTTSTNYPAGSFGTTSTNYQGLINAANIAASLVSTPNGNVNATYTPQGASIAPYVGDATAAATHTNDVATPDADKIYLIADILASCVNSASSSSAACTGLFGAAVPPPAPATTTLGSTFTYPTATNTMAAAYYMAINPTNATTAGTPNTANITTLYDLATSTPPFPYSEAQPTDWTIGVVYSSSAYGATNLGFVSAPTNLSVDANGYVYYLTSSTTLPNQAISGLNPYGGVSTYADGSFQGLQGYTIDGKNYGYTTKTANKYTYALTNGTANLYSDEIEDSNDSNLLFEPANFASDGVNLFMTTATTGDTGSIFQVPAVTQSGSPFTSATTTTSPVAALNAGHTISGVTLASPIVADSAKHVYVAAGSSVYQTTYTSTVPSGASGATPVSISGTFVSPTALAVDNSNNLWIANTSGGSPANGYISYYNPSTSTTVSDSVAGDGGVDNPAGIAVDGRGNIWVANAGSGTSFTGQTVSEFALISGTLTALSPSNGFPHTYSQPGSIAIDLSGNVWVANTGTKANQFTDVITKYSISSNVVTFIVGSNQFTAGQSVTLSGFPTSTFFNGQTVTVLSTGLSSGQFEANFTYANTSSTTEAAVATLAGSAATAGSITCIIGAASPVVTSIAKGIGSGTQGSLP